MRIREFLTEEEGHNAEGNLDQEVSGLTYDSRQAGVGKIFFAVPGEKSDGHDYIGEALRRGAAGIVVSRPGPWQGAPATIRVENVRRAMGGWAARYYNRPGRRMRLVGITGTNGKTTVSYLVEAILAAAGLRPGVIGTVNYRYPGHELPSHQTTPESVDLQEMMATMQSAGVRAVAMEVSSHALVQERVHGVDFDVGVFTNLSRDHLDYHRDMDDYFAAKSRLFTECLPQSAKPNKAAVIYGGDPRAGQLGKLCRDHGLALWSYGEDAACDVHPVGVENDRRGLRGRVKAKERLIDFESPLVGYANLQNILGAIGVGCALGLRDEAMVAGLKNLRRVPGRLEKVDNDLDIAILVDYAHTPDALEKVCQVARTLTQHKLIVVFGCGGDRDRGKRPLMGEIAARLSDLAVLTSDNPRTEAPLAILAEVEAGVTPTGRKQLPPVGMQLRASLAAGESGYIVEADRRQAIITALAAASAGDVVLIAGKGHEDYQILGTEKIHFDDREVARDAVLARAQA